MKRIEVLTNFKHGSASYWQGEVRHVSPEDAGYFCGLGWAKDLGGEIPTGILDTTEKTLDVHGSKHAAKAATVGAKKHG